MKGRCERAADMLQKRGVIASKMKFAPGSDPSDSPRGLDPSDSRLKFADTYYGEMTHYGLYRLAWADMRRTRD